MQDSSRYAVGIDVGTTTVRCVVGHIDATTGTPTIVGVGEVKNNGMRKGTVVNLNGVAPIIDQALNEAEVTISTGCFSKIIDSVQAGDFVKGVVSAYRDETGLNPAAYVCRASEGASEVKMVGPEESD